MLSLQCSLCGKRFKNTCKLRRHKNRHQVHEIFPPEIIMKIITSSPKISIILNIYQEVLNWLKTCDYTQFVTETQDLSDHYKQYIMDLILTNVEQLTKDDVPNRYAVKHFYDDVQIWDAGWHQWSIESNFDRLATVHWFGYACI